MAKKNVKSDFDDIQFEDEFDFDDSEFEDSEEEEKSKRRTSRKRRRRKYYGQTLFVVIVLLLIAVIAVKLIKWNQGEVIEIDPFEDTSEFDTEPNDYIQPMTSEQLAGKLDDGVISIVTIGNSPFADDYHDNLLEKAIAEQFNAKVYNEAIQDSFQTRTNPIGDDSDPNDANSLYDVVARLVEGDMSDVDCIMISYDISDYIELKNIYNPWDEDDVTTFCGALSASIKLIQEKYPYIRIVVISPPAAGKTIDGYYVDGTIANLANGTLNDYIGQEVAVCASRGVSFVDIYFGVINVDTREQYLVDDYHFNEAGARAVAERLGKLISLD